MHVHEHVHLSVSKKDVSNAGNKKETRWALLLFGAALSDLFIRVLDDFHANQVISTIWCYKYETFSYQRNKLAFCILIVAQKILKIKIRIIMICLGRNKAVGLSLTLLNKNT